MVKVLFLRHGESIANFSRQFCGQMDSPLTETGLIQAEEVANFIVNNYNVSAVYSSDLTRVKQTVAPTAKALGLKITETKLLREVDVGAWQGKTFDYIEENDSERFLKYKNGDTTVKLGGAESFEDLRTRALKVVDMILSENDGKTVLVATHGGIIRVLIEKYFNITDVEMRKKYPIHNASLTEVDYVNGKANVRNISLSEYLTNVTNVDPNQKK
jgi:broad specificity phosphatase PhoE